MSPRRKQRPLRFFTAVPRFFAIVGVALAMMGGALAGFTACSVSLPSDNDAWLLFVVNWTLGGALPGWAIAAIAAVRAKSPLSQPVWVALGAAFGGACAIAYDAMVMQGLLNTYPSGLIGSSMTLVGTLLGFGAHRWRSGKEHAAPMCLRCGYNLTGLSGRRCPECGEAF